MGAIAGGPVAGKRAHICLAFVLLCLDLNTDYLKVVDHNSKQPEDNLALRLSRTETNEGEARLQNKKNSLEPEIDFATMPLVIRMVR